MYITKVRLHNWRNFKDAEFSLRDTSYIIGANASGKSNLLDIFRFVRDIAKPDGGGLQKAISSRGGLTKVRCLHARTKPEVTIELEICEDIDDSEPAWIYKLEIVSEPRGQHRPVIKSEVVIRYGKIILCRPDRNDEDDPASLTETALEQIKANRDFRELATFFSKVTYLHLVPQLLKFGDHIGGRRLEEDPFGQGFLEKIAKAPDRTQKGRLKAIQDALVRIVPQMSDLSFVKDHVDGRPHLEIRYKHHRPNAGLQREDQFSDGTLRLIALFWSLLDGDSLLLLEEPELSLNEEIVKNITLLIDRLHRKKKSKKRQIIITTHSYALLSSTGIDPRSITILIPSDEGTTSEPASESEFIAMKAGFSVAEVVLPRVQKLSAGQLALEL